MYLRWLVSDGREVLRTLVFKQSEVQTREGQWYLARIMPYRTADNVIDGLVLTFVDINPVKEAQKTLRRMSKVFTAALDPILILDLTGHVVDLNDEAVRCYGYLREELCGQSVTALIPRGQRESFQEQLLRCRDGETLRNVDCVRRTKDGREQPGLMTLSLLTDERGEADAMGMLDRQGAVRPSAQPQPSGKTPRPKGSA